MAQERRIDRILSSEYSADVQSRNDDELSAMRTEVTEVETEVSYLRRLAQARMDIIKAEIDRRASGGSVGDLVAALPEILTSGEKRTPASQTDTRVPQSFAPNTEITYSRGLEKLVSDETLANLPSIPEDELQSTLGQLSEFEKEMSSARQQLHSVLDAIENAIATRRAAQAS